MLTAPEEVITAAIIIWINPFLKTSKAGKV
jgi:hypothetical protein